MKPPAGIVAIVAACVSGFCGGLVANGFRAQALAPQVESATRFVLVDQSGRRLGTWEAGSDGDARFEMFSENGVKTLGLYQSPEGSPRFLMRGRDGKPRISMTLNADDKPLFGMGDERWEGSILLGSIPPDTKSAASDEWGLLFRPFGTEKSITGLGMSTVKGHTEGFLQSPRPLPNRSR